MLELIVLSLSVIANLMLATIVLAKNPMRVVNRYFTFFAIAFVGWAITNYFSLHPIVWEQLFWIRLDIAWAAVMTMALLLLANIFPTSRPRFRRLEAAVVLPGIAVVLLAMSPWLFTHVDYSGGSAQPVPGPGIIFFVMYVLGSLTLSGVILFEKFFHLRGIEKEYIRYALIGIISTFSLLVIFNFILVLVFHNTSFIVFTPAFGLIFTTSFAYGMIRYRLFDIRFIVARFVAYLLTLLFVGGVYGFVAVALSYFIVGIRPSNMQILSSAIIVGVLLLFVQPLRQFFNRVTRALFYQDDYDTKDVLDRLTSVLVRSTDTKVLVEKSVAILGKALKSNDIAILLIDESQREKPRVMGSHKESSELKHSNVAMLLAHVQDVAVAEELDSGSTQLHRSMEKVNTSVIARLETQGGVIGFCFFGYKSTGSTYSKRDIELIRIASDELAVAIQNTLRFEEIQAFNDTLKQRIEEATKELRASNIQLQRLDEAKDEFVSMASHQLRTPLTSVKGYISMVLEGDVGKITAAQRQLLSEAFTSSERMVHLINDFLNVSRLQTGKFVIESRAVDLAKIVTQEVESLQTTAHAHGLKLQFRPPSYFPILYLDEGKIRQVLMNFIDNAIYYSREDTTVEVTLTTEEGDAVLKVHDTGIGVPKAEQAHLFTKFFRATNARKQRPDGTGVGLFLAKKIVMAHGGSMIVESVEDEGSTFGFRLPIKKLSTAPTEHADELDK